MFFKIPREYLVILRLCVHIKRIRNMICRLPTNLILLIIDKTVKLLNDTFFFDFVH